MSGRASFLPFEMACGVTDKRPRELGRVNRSHLLHCRVFPQCLEDVLVLRWIRLLTPQVERANHLIEERLWTGAKSAVQLYVISAGWTGEEMGHSRIAPLFPLPERTELSSEVSRLSSSMTARTLIMPSIRLSHIT